MNDPKYLIFVEPIIETDQPSQRSWWLNRAQEMIEALFPMGDFDESRLKVVMSEYFWRKITTQEKLISGPDLSYWHNFPKSCVTSIAMQDFKQVVNGHALSAVQSFEDETCSDETLAGVAKFYKETLGGFKPDVILTMSPVPFLRQAFPDAMVISQETSAFSLAPYPYTVFWDVCGIRRHSSLSYFNKELKDLQLTDEIKHDMARLRKAFVDELLIPKNPFKGVIAEIRKQYDSVWLCPRIIFGMPGEDRSIPAGNPLDVMAWVLEQAGPKNAVIFMEHPGVELYLNRDRVDYLQTMFPNFVYLEDEWKYRGSSHFLLPEVDGVINGASNLGGLTMLHQKKLVSMGRSQYDHLSHQIGLNDLSEVANQPYDEQRDAIFHWILTHYSVPHDRYQTSGALKAFVDRGLKLLIDKGKIDFSVYRPETTASKAIDHLIATRVENVPLERTKLPMLLSLDKYRRLAISGTII